MNAAFERSEAIPAGVVPSLFRVFAPIVALLALAAVLTALGIAHQPPLRARYLAGAAISAALAGLVGMFQLYRQSYGRQVARRDLFDVERRVSNILESAMDPILTIDQHQRVVGFNRAAEVVFGRSRADVLGGPLDPLIPSRYRDAHRAHVDRFGASGTTARRMGAQMVLAGLRVDGSEFPIEASISQHLEHGAPLYTVILRDVTERLAVEAELRASRDELRELGAAAHLTREHETQRIARELHDELGQSLTMLQMDVAWCRAHVEAGIPALAAKLERMADLLKSTIASTRRIASDLRPLLLDDLGLVSALEWLAQNFSQRTGVACMLTTDKPQIDLEMARASAVFRIVQESLTNVARHARATRARIELAHSGDTLEVRVIDDGVGLPQASTRKPDSFGLLGIRERVSFLGGTVSVTGFPGAGTTVEVHLPIAAAGAAQGVAARNGGEGAA